MPTHCLSPLVPLRELVTIERTTTDKGIYHKNLMPVTYVIGDVAGTVESPVYAILKMNRALRCASLAGQAPRLASSMRNRPKGS
jgi:multidrug efflux pump subunit AcrB